MSESDPVAILLNNPYLGQFLMSLCSSFGSKVADNVSEWVIGSLKRRLQRRKTPDEDIAKVETTMASFVKRKGVDGFLAKAFWMEFLTFMFPERGRDARKLTEEDCDYISARTCAAFELESLLFAIGYAPKSVSYMAQIQGKKSRLPYFFDLKASYEQDYFDNLLVARVIDSRVCIPTDYIKSIPMLVQDVNGDVTASPAALRDHDLFAVVQTGEIDNSGQIMQAVKTVQSSYDVSLPRILYFTEEELERLIMMEREKAKGFLISRIKEVKPFRG